MVGSMLITIKAKGKYTFSLHIDRNLTLITGESGTFKTLMINTILASKQDKKYFSVEVETKEFDKSAVTVDVLTPNSDWDSIISKSKNCVFFIDECASYVYTREFASVVKFSDNYFVIVNRHISRLNTLPIALSEVYELVATDLDDKKGKLIKNVEHFKSVPVVTTSTIYNSVLTEDRKSGYQLMSAILSYKHSNIPCESANGKDNIVSKVVDMPHPCVVVADRAAFGISYYAIDSDINTKEKLGKDIYFWLPESIEYFMLFSMLFKNFEKSNKASDLYKTLINSLVQPEVDSTKFFSWENYYTFCIGVLLSEIGVSTDTKYTYNKSTLPSILKTDERLEEFARLLPFIIQED